MPNHRLYIKVLVPVWFGLCYRTHWDYAGTFKSWNDAAGWAHNVCGMPTSDHYRITRSS